MEANRLVAERHFNPVDFPYLCPPPGARFFVIKSFTEDDVHKSLKHEIWASTEKGNARLDRAFRETKNLPAAPASVASADGAAGQGPPIYLFYSVNASGHFCGMAEMLSPLDYNTTSNVWAQENKWKGIFKVRWIYVKDLPNNQLRHLRLTNTTEQKPVTQSRDTQELPSNVGQEMLRIMAEFPAKTSLLQDFAFYEMQSHQNEAQKKAATAAAAAAAGSVGQPTGTPGLPHPASGMMSAPPPHVLLPMPTSSPMPFYQQATPFFGSDPAASLRYQQQLQNLFLNRPPQYQTQLPQQPFLQQQRQRGSQPYIPSPQPSPGFPHA
ncbi:YTH-domain-containing protein [Tilletiaria anomala UBC 951]|uniref:YTH-domain-containing protein n=1 Tax=Tilletiaria anomala (strain ATCC 24038 / CBS 436.72 / UBC 951) TaxID=1037660 RepID=A0A066VX01_TILAU|nr:YTH-domain-containing protein [Tilletiaria anomala UBC 951]KDN43319.1 YTH-domain-containing protein [Tilletiaria anomala UBC 951]